MCWVLRVAVARPGRRHDDCRHTFSDRRSRARDINQVICCFALVVVGFHWVVVVGWGLCIAILVRPGVYIAITLGLTIDFHRFVPLR